MTVIYDPTVVDACVVGLSCVNISAINIGASSNPVGFLDQRPD